jgi:hypothetical protein
MHQIEPFYNWHYLYRTEDDKLSPFFEKQYNEFQFSQTIYNYYIHPQWDFFGSRTLYLKILMVDYDQRYCIIELLGEWNDAIENDIMTLKREIAEHFMSNSIYKFIFIGENVINFHSGDKDYYQEWFEEVTEEQGWIALINLHEVSANEFRKTRLEAYIPLFTIPEWRTFKPHHLYSNIDRLMSRYIDFEKNE